MTFVKNAEFIVKLGVFSLTFYYTLDFIFKSDIHNTLGFSIVAFIIALISITFYTFKMKIK